MERMEDCQVSHSFLPLPSVFCRQKELAKRLPYQATEVHPCKVRSEINHRKCQLRALVALRAVTRPHVSISVWMMCIGGSQVPGFPVLFTVSCVFSCKIL